MEKLKNIAFGFGWIALWAHLIDQVLAFGEVWGHPLAHGNGIISRNYFVTGIILAPAWEEICFRWAPITLARRTNEEVMWPVIILSSALFGWIHGHGPNSVLMQGMIGIVFSWVYIKNGFSIASSIFLHMLWNTYCGLYL